MSGKHSDVMRKWQAAADWHNNTRNVVKLATKLSDLVNTLIADSDALSEELLRLYKSLSSNDDVEVIECSVMALRNILKSFVFLQRGMMGRIVEHFDVPSYNAELAGISEKKKTFLKAVSEYDENMDKTQEAIRKKKIDEKALTECGKELDRLNKVVDINKSSFEASLNTILNQHATVYGRCLLQLMDRQHEFFQQGWEVLSGLQPKLAVLEDRLTRQDDGSKEGYLMKKSGFSWNRYYVSLRGSRLLWQCEGSKEPKAIDVRLCTVRMRTNAGEFEVISPSKERPLVLQAETEMDRIAWMDALQNAIAVELQGPAKPIATISSNSNVANSVYGKGHHRQASVSLTPLLQTIEGNFTCADCDAVEPDWASINLGILLCLECSGVHRSMGTHISKVRSLTLDTWDPETILLAQRIGNKRSNDFFEAISPSTTTTPKPSGLQNDRETRIKFIQAKYKELKFVNDVRRSWDTTQLLDALAEEAAHGDVHELIILVLLGANPNATSPTSGVLPIISATRNGNIFALEALVQNGADVASADSQGWTALHHAASLNLVQCGALLLRRGLGDKAQNVIDIRASAYQLAVKKSSDSMARLLKDDMLANHVARQMLNDATPPLTSSSPISPTPTRARSLTRSLSRSSDTSTPSSLDSPRATSSPSITSSLSTSSTKLQPIPLDLGPNTNTLSQSNNNNSPSPSPSPAGDDESGQERSLVNRSGLIVQVVSEMKAQVAQSPNFSPTIPTRVETVITQLDQFFRDQRLPTPEIPGVPHASHPLQLQLNKILGYVSMICKAYQLAPTPSTARLYNSVLKEIHHKIIDGGGGYMAL